MKLWPNKERKESKVGSYLENLWRHVPWHQAKQEEREGRHGDKADQFLVCYWKFTPFNANQFFFLFVCFSFPITIITISVSFHDFLFGVPFFWLNHHLLTILSSQWFSSYRPAFLKNFVESCVPVSKKITKNVPQWYLGVYRQSFAFHEDRL